MFPTTALMLTVLNFRPPTRKSEKKKRKCPQAPKHVNTIALLYFKTSYTVYTSVSFKSAYIHFRCFEDVNPSLISLTLARLLLTKDEQVFQASTL